MSDKTEIVKECDVIYRGVRVSTEDFIVDEEKRIITFPFSSELPVRRRSLFGDPWLEVLGHRSDEANFDRLNTNAPFLFEHAQDDIDKHLGSIRRAWLDNARGFTEIKVSSLNDVDKYWNRIKEGTLRNVSTGYRILKRTLLGKERGLKKYRVEWEPVEVSLVTAPEDHTVGIGRRSNSVYIYRGDNMPDDLKNTDVENETSEEKEDKSSEETSTRSVKTDQTEPKSEPKKEPESKRSVDTDSIKSEERTRIQELRRIGGVVKASDDDISSWIDEGLSVDQVRAKAIDSWEESQKGNNVNSNTRATTVEDKRDKFLKGAEQWMMARSGLAEFDPKNEYNDLSLREILVRSYEINDIEVRGVPPEELLVRAGTIGMHATGDFPAIMSNVAQKALMDAYQEEPATYTKWCKIGNLPNFKETERQQMGGFDNLRQVPEGAEVKYVTTSDRKETYKLYTYAEKFAITRQALINDDLGAFLQVPVEFGYAAASTVNALPYGVLTDNAAMSDNVALFHANHGNLASPGTALSATSFSAAKAAMKKQKSLGVTSGGRNLNIKPKYLLVPVAIEDDALLFMESQFEVTNNKNNTTPNIHRKSAEVISDALLDDDSETAWYTVGQRNTVEVGFLNGRRTPTIQRMPTSDVLGVTWLIYIDAGAKAIDWKAMYKNPGA